MASKRANFTFIDLFAGVGGMRLAFQSVGGRCVFSSEIDRYACDTYEANFGERPHGDITEIAAAEIPRHDVLLAGFPCQPFSRAGHRKGFKDTRGTLFFEIQRVLQHHLPRLVLLENVKGFAGHDGGRTFAVVKENLELLGYEVHAQILNARDFGLPQNRERMFIVGIHRRVRGERSFHFPKPPEKPTRVADVLDKNVPEKYTISDRLWQGHQRRRRLHEARGNGWGYGIVWPNSKYTRTISARYFKDGSEILVGQRNRNPRKLTPREAARLQGFPNSFRICVSDARAYHQFGNAVPVPVVKAIARRMVRLLSAG